MSELDPNVKALIDVMSEQNKTNAKTIEKIESLAGSVGDLTIEMSKHIVKMEHQESCNEEFKTEIKEIKTDVSQYKSYSKPILSAAEKAQTNRSFVFRSLSIAFIIAVASSAMNVWEHFQSVIKSTGG